MAYFDLTNVSNSSTWLKRDTETPAKYLDYCDKIELEPGQRKSLEAYEEDARHKNYWRVWLDPAENRPGIWYAFREHVRITKVISHPHP